LFNNKLNLYTYIHKHNTRIYKKKLEKKLQYSKIFLYILHRGVEV